MEAIRRLAREQGRTITDFVNELLVEGLERRREKAEPQQLALPSFSMGRPRVNLADREALHSLMDGILEVV